MSSDALAVSVLIFTKNESADLPGCLHSVAWCNDVHVVDSGSTDHTVAVAQQLGAQVWSRTYPDIHAPFGGNESAHKNWALSTIDFRHPWVLMLDADERCTDDLIRDMQIHCTPASPASAYRIHRRDHFLGTWIKHVTPSPFNIRLIRPGKVHFDRIINPVTVVDGPTLELDSHFNHFPFSKGISHWFAKHNGYSTFEAQHIIDQSGGKRRYQWRKALFSRDPNERRLHQKGLYYRMPLRPVLMFLALYVGKRGFLDGRAGFVYAVLRSIYEYMIVLKVDELTQPALLNTSR